MAELTHLILSSLCLGVLPLGLGLAEAVLDLIGLDLELGFCQPTHILGGLRLLGRRVIIHFFSKKVEGLVTEVVLVAFSLVEGQGL